MCYFSVAIKIVYGKLGAIRVVTSQLGFARPFSIRIFARNVVPTVLKKSFYDDEGNQSWNSVVFWVEIYLSAMEFTTTLKPLYKGSEGTD